MQIGPSGHLLAFFLIFRIVGGAVEQADHVRVLFDGAGFAKVGDAGDAQAGSRAAFRTAVELGQNDDRHFEFLGQGFEAGGYFRHFSFTAVGRLFGVGAHELEIVHADGCQTALVPHDPARFGPEFVDGDGCGIVNDKLGSPHFLDGLFEVLHFKLGEVASLDDFPAADSGTGEKKAFHNLDCGHFTGKEQSRLFFVKRDVLNDVEQKGGFTHGGTGGDDEHVPRFKPVAFFVQFLKSRGQSLDLAFACDKFFKIGDGLFKDAGQALFILGAVIAFPYLENMGFHRIQQFRYVVRIVKGLRGGLVGDVNDGAEDEFVLQDIEVMLKIGSGGGKGVYFRQARASAYGFQLVHVFQSLGDGNDVNGFVFVIAGLEKAPEQLVRGEVEVVLRHADGHALPHVSGRVHGHEGQHSFFRAGSLRNVPEVQGRGFAGGPGQFQRGNGSGGCRSFHGEAAGWVASGREG